MEISSFRNLAELGMDDPVFFHQWPDKSLEQLNYASSMASTTSGDFHHPFSQQPVLDFKRALESYQLAGHDRPLKQLKPDIWNPVEMVKPKGEAWSLNLPPVFESQNHVTRPCQVDKKMNNTSTRDSQVQDHILAERKRREKLSQRLIALSALVPGLKKMDKASVLGDAIKHMKHLQEKVKILEEQTKKRSIESVVFVKKYEVLFPENDQNSSQSDASFPTSAEPLPQVEARFCGKDVLITIHCEKGKGMFEKAVAEIEKLNLSIVNSCVMTYGDSALNITVIAQKDEGYKINMEELVDNLRSAVKILM